MKEFIGLMESSVRTFFKEFNSEKLEDKLKAMSKLMTITFLLVVISTGFNIWSYFRIKAKVNHRYYCTISILEDIYSIKIDPYKAKVIKWYKEIDKRESAD